MPKTLNLPKPHCSKTVSIQDCPAESSPDSDSDSDPLNYYGSLPVVIKMSGEGILQTITP